MRLRFLLVFALLFSLLAGCGTESAPTLTISAQQKGEGLVIYIKTTDFTYGEDGHVHIRIDGGPEAMIYANTYTIPHLEPGLHSIYAELSNNRHEPLGANQTLEVEIKR